MFTLGGDGLNLPPEVADSAEDNVVVGSTFDRCSSFGSVVKGSSNIAFSGCNFFRNSRNDGAETDDAHVYLDGPISAIFAAINTKYGRDDDGSGPLSPRHSLAWGPDADSALVSFTASNLRGYTQSVQTGRPSASLQFAGSFT